MEMGTSANMLAGFGFHLGPWWVSHGALGGSACGRGRGAGSGGRGRRKFGGGGDEGPGESDDEYLRRVRAWLEQRRTTLEKWDPKVAHAWSNGVISVRQVWNFLAGTGVPGGSLILWSLGNSARARFLADEFFMTRIGLELGLGLVGKTSAELSVRRERFIPELDFYFANLITALLADFFLGYLPAPSVNITGKELARSAWSSFVQGLPSNIFQRGAQFSFLDRVVALVLKSAQLASVGLGCAAVGFALSNISIAVRERLFPDSGPPTPKTDVIAVSLVYALFLATSSCMRYQLVAGIENRVFPQIMGNRPLALQTSSFLLRFGNTFLGSSHWIFFARYFGLMTTSDH